ncbi:MAG: matrixin family metalloprotease [Planctomycetia bacterium]|nr:matrixin family metalloprotease [Planctomycetia bacterium]
MLTFFGLLPLTAVQAVQGAPPAVAANTPASAGVVVLVNRADGPVEIRMATTDGRPISQTLAPLDVLPLPVTGVTRVDVLSGKQPRSYGLNPASVYYFAPDGKGNIDLTEVGLNTAADAAKPDTRAGAVDAARLNKITTIPVKILVDDNEVAKPQVWQTRLTKRLEAANEILEKTCRVRFQIVAFDTWHSDNKVNDFTKTLQEFEKTVQPQPAAVAIGFTSQYAVFVGRQHLGGTRSLLHPFILIREYGPQTSERERLEVLLHELGHYLGAVHSPEPDSVMRPVLGDNRSNPRAFRVMFDPVSALAINLVANDWAQHGVRRPDQITAATRGTLADIYRLMVAAFPADPAAANYLRIMQESDFSTPAAGAAAIVRAIAAQDARFQETVGTAQRPTSDELADLYIRAAVVAAMSLPPESRQESLLLGLGVALGGQKSLAAQMFGGDGADLTAPVLSGVPTIRSRAALLQRFVTAAAYARLAGPAATEAASLTRQLNASHTELGFSLADLAVDLAGIRFAQALASGDVQPAQLASTFSVSRFVPNVDDLEAAMTEQAFATRFGSVYDPRFRAELEKLKTRINSLPGYAGVQ